MIFKKGIIKHQNLEEQKYENKILEDANDDIFLDTDDKMLEDTNDGIFLNTYDLYKNIRDLNDALIVIKIQQFILFNKIPVLTSLYVMPEDKTTFLSTQCAYLDYYSELIEKYNKMILVSKTIENENKETILEILAKLAKLTEQYKIIIDENLEFLSDFFGVKVTPDLLSSEINGETNLLDENILIEAQNEGNFILKQLEDIGKISSSRKNKKKISLFNFFDKNFHKIISVAKNSGLNLTSTTLQNDENIFKVANIVHGLLPMPIRIVINVNMVENFLLEHREWVIKKLNKG